jgi:hypothetical protein
VVHLSFTPGKLALRAAPAAASPERAVAVPVAVADGRGSGAGWTLKAVSARQLMITSITARCASGSTCTLPRAARAPSGATVLQTAPDTGMGVIQLVVTVARLSSGPAAPIAFAVS